MLVLLKELFALLVLAPLAVFEVELELLAGVEPLLFVLLVAAVDEIAEPPLSCWLISSNSNSNLVGVNILFRNIPQVTAKQHKLSLVGELCESGKGKRKREREIKRQGAMVSQICVSCTTTKRRNVKTKFFLSHFSLAQINKKRDLFDEQTKFIQKESSMREPAPRRIPTILIWHHNISILFTIF